MTRIRLRARMLAFGAIEIDGERFDSDVVIEGGQVRRRRKKPSKPYRDRFGHTPLSIGESIPWAGPRLIVGTGVEGRLPVMVEVHEAARRRDVEIVAVPTAEACRLIAELDAEDVNAVLHVTC